MIAAALAGLLSLSAAAAPLPGTVLNEVDADSAAWTAYQRIHSDFFDLDKIVKADPREADLGRKLFFDPRLSGNGAMSCWNCHDPSRAWGDGLKRARGIGNKLLSRNTPSLLTLHRNIPHPFFWDGRAENMEKVVLEEMLNPDEMGGDRRRLVATFDRVPLYARLMTELYGPAGASPESAAKAIAAFLRTEVHPDETPFDRYVRDPSALSPAAKRGMIVYAGKARCLLCHTGAFFSDDFFHNVGLRGTPGLEDAGRGALVPEKHAVRAFHTPPLRDVARTGPYMHDGSEKTLRDIVEFYNRGGDVRDADQDDLVIPLDMTEQEKADLVVFLEALSSPVKETALPALPPEVRPTSAPEAFAAAESRLDEAAAAARAGNPELAAAHAASAREALDEWGAMDGGACVASAARAASALEAAADARAADLAARGARAKRALASCRPPPEADDADVGALPPPSALIAAADVSISSASRLLDEAAADAPGPDGTAPDPLPSFDMARFLSDLGSGRWSPENTDRLEQAVSFDVLRYYEYKTFLAGNPSACQEIKIHKIYFGVDRTGPYACTERHYENELNHALVVRPPDFERICRESVVMSYPQLEAKDAVGACAVISSHLNRPGPCAALIGAGYLSPDKLVSCGNFFERFYEVADPSSCDILNGGPTQWRDRCRALSAFFHARKARDPKLCGDKGLCLAFMGDRADSLDAAGAKVRALAVGVLRSGWPYEVRPRAESALALVADARARLEAAEAQRGGSDRALAAALDEREDALARLSERAERLRALPPPKGADGPGPG